MEETLQKALIHLNVGLDEIEITMLNEGNKEISETGSENVIINARSLSSEGNELDQEIELAYGVLNALLSKMGLNAAVNIEYPETAVDEEGEINPVTFNIVGDDVEILVGRRGQTLDALQFVVRLITSKNIKFKVPIIVDVENYKHRRYEDLKALAVNVAAQVRTRKTSIRLEPMSAYERRIIHMTLADDPDVMTDSTGEGESRRVVIMPKRK